MARNHARLRMNFYPLPEPVAEQIGRRLSFQGLCSMLDPCAGEGKAFIAMTRHARACRRYGIELDAYRAEEAAKVLDFVVQGDTLNTRSKVESFSLIFCNPPFDFEQGEQGGNRRMEYIFAAHIARWLVPEGILVLVIPRERLSDCARILAYHFADLRAYRLEAQECEQYRQIVVLARAKTRREREKTTDQVITQTQAYLSSHTRDPRLITPLSEADVTYIVPPSGPAELVYDGLPLDIIEDLLPGSSAYRQVTPVLNPQPLTLQTRPLTPLHKGHIGLLAVAGAILSPSRWNCKAPPNQVSSSCTGTLRILFSGDLPSRLVCPCFPHGRPGFRRGCNLKDVSGNSLGLTARLSSQPAQKPSSSTGSGWH